MAAPFLGAAEHDLVQQLNQQLTTPKAGRFREAVPERLLGQGQLGLMIRRVFVGAHDDLWLKVMCPTLRRRNQRASVASRLTRPGAARRSRLCGVWLLEGAGCR